MTGLLGTGPRAMPLRAAPGEKLGAAVCAAETKRTRNRCYRRALRGACQVVAQVGPHLHPSQP